MSLLKTGALIVLVALVAWAPYRNFTTDDAFIHYRFARNLAHGAGFSFNPDVPTYGDTSPAWVLLVAAAGAALTQLGVADVAPVGELVASVNGPRAGLPERADLVYAADAWRLASKLLDLAAMIAAVLLFLALARRRAAGSEVNRTWAAVVVTLLFVFDPWWTKWGLAGMETPLAVALALASLWSRDRMRNSGRVDPWTPLLLGVACLVRPECGLLIVALMIDALVVERHRRWWNIALAGVVPSLVIAPWLLYAWREFGVVVPNTMAARRDLNYSQAYVLFKMAKILGSTYALALVGVLLGAWHARGGAEPALRGAEPAPHGAEPAVRGAEPAPHGAEPAVRGAEPAVRGTEPAVRGAEPEPHSAERWWRAQLYPLASVLLVLGFYAVWRVSVGARYVLLVSPFLVLIGYSGWFAVFPGRAARIALLAVVLANLLAVQWMAVRFVTDWPLGLDARLFRVAYFLEAGTEPDAVVAAHEIGVLGHVGERSLVDLASLVSPDVVPVARTGSVAASLGDRRVDYLVWNSNVSPDTTLLADMRGRIEPLLVERVHREGSSHRGGWQYYTVYRVAQ